MSGSLHRATACVGALLLGVLTLAACGGAEDEAQHTARWCELMLEASTQRLEAERRAEAGGPGPGAHPGLLAAEERAKEHGWPAGLREAGAVIEQGMPMPYDDEWEAHAEALEELEDFARTECEFDPAAEELLFGSGESPS